MMADAKPRLVGDPGVAAGPEPTPRDASNAEISLRKRVKELACLYQLCEVVEGCEGSADPSNALFRSTVDILPESWLHSEVACARIVSEGREYTTAGFQESPWVIASDLVITGRCVGTVEVRYLEERPTRDDGPFLTEERSLLNAVAKRLGRAVERLQAQQIVRIEQAALRHKHIALRQVLNEIQREKEEVGHRVMANIDKIVLPVLDDLERGLPERQRKIVTILRDSLLEIVSPFVDQLSSRFEALTPTEIRVCALVRRGMSCKEVAAVEHISPGTVRVHRFKIRRKLGLLNRKVNLQEFLQSTMPNATSG